MCRPLTALFAPHTHPRAYVVHVPSTGRTQASGGFHPIKPACQQHRRGDWGTAKCVAARWVGIAYAALTACACRCREIVCTGSFIAGYAVSSLVFGHLVHYYNPFLLMSIGLGLWCCAVVASGMAPDYWVLLAARICSGVGEASFQTTVPPWLDDNAPAVCCVRAAVSALSSPM